MKTQITEEDEMFENYKLNFPTNRRLKNYRRFIATANTLDEKK